MLLCRHNYYMWFRYKLREKAGVRVKGLDDVTFFVETNCPLSLSYLPTASKFIALLIPSCPGAPFDLSGNPYLGEILNSFAKEKSKSLSTRNVERRQFYLLPLSISFSEPVCAVGFGTFGLFSTLNRQSQEWNFTNYSLTSVSARITVTNI